MRHSSRIRRADCSTVMRDRLSSSSIGEIPADLQVTKARLLEIAAEEEVAVESDDNKPDLQAKIIAARAAKAEVLI